MSDKWMNDMRNLLGEHETDVPDKLLDDIKQEMLRRQLRVSVPPARRAELVPRWYRGVAAAAAVVLLAGGGLWWWQHYGEASMVAGRPTGQVARMGHEPHQASSAVADRAAESRPSAVDAAPLLAMHVAASSADGIVTEAERPVADMPEGASAPSEREGEVTSQADESTAEQATRPRKNNDIEHLLAGRMIDPVIDRKATSRFSASIYMGGMASNTPVASDMAYYDMANSAVVSLMETTTKRPSSPLDIVSDPTSAADHHRPVRLGVQVSYRVADRWALRTGLTYSYLSSVFTPTGITAVDEVTQKLHYVGIPVGVGYKLWGNRHMQVYTTVGAEIEKLVDGRASTKPMQDIPAVKEKVTERRPQFSVNAALGAAYHFTDWMSIYLEPGVSHYFDNHSTVQNYYKDKPTGFNLNMGLRIDVNK